MFLQRETLGQCFTFASSRWGVVDDHQQILGIGNDDEFLLLRPQPEQLQFVLRPSVFHRLLRGREWLSRIRWISPVKERRSNYLSVQLLHQISRRADEVPHYRGQLLDALILS